MHSPSASPDRSLAERLAANPAALAEFTAGLTEDESRALEWDWSFWARPKQIAPPGDWRTWLILAGRGFGKTRTAAQWVQGEAESGRRRRLAIVTATAGDARDVMVEGESGILAVSPPWCRPKYEPSKRRLTWPNGARATLFSADEPDRLRGPQHDGAVADELAAWRYPEAWDQLMFGLRLGRDPRVVVATTPRPTPIIRDLLRDPTTVATTGSTYENATNLAAPFLAKILSKYEGTRLGRQELYAEILDDSPGALWKRGALEGLRVTRAPDLSRVVVAVDPAVSSTEDSDETGIVVVGLGANDGRLYVLDDGSMGRATPHEWASEVVALYRRHRADRVVAEVNQGGDLVEATIRTVDPNIPYSAVRATRGKAVRAEPVAALYEQGRVHHVGLLARLEDQMVTWDPSAGGKSPDRVDALVWAVTELLDLVGAEDQGALIIPRGH